MGWQFRRVWSTDWFYRRGEASERLKTALEASTSERGSGDPRTEPKRLQDPPQFEAMPGSPSLKPASDLRMPAYKMAAGIAVTQNIEPHQATPAVMARVTKSIVEVEGPVHQDEVARRVTALFGKSRTGPLIAAATLQSLNAHRSSSALIEDGGFWMTAAQMNSPPIRDRSKAPPSLQRAETFSPLEIRAAFTVAQRENGTMTEEEMTVAIARLLGFRRTGSDLRTAILRSIQN
jgi:Protein of unknown function (DUF3320)